MRRTLEIETWSETGDLSIGRHGDGQFGFRVAPVIFLAWKKGKSEKKKLENKLEKKKLENKSEKKKSEKGRKDLLWEWALGNTGLGREHRRYEYQPNPTA